MLLVFLISLGLSIFFSGMETAALLVNRARVRHLKEQGSFGARILLNFLQHPSRLLSTILIGNTLANTVGVVSLVCYAVRWGAAVAMASGVLFGFVLWLIGDVVPKTVFRRYPNRMSVFLAPLLGVCYLVLWPLVHGFDLVSQLLIHVKGKKRSSHRMFVTREELKLLAREARSGLRLSTEQRNFVQAVLDHPRISVQDVMRNREEVITLKAEQSEEDRSAIALAKGFSRYPVESASLTGASTWEGVWVIYDQIFLQKAQVRAAPSIAAKTRLTDSLAIMRKMHSPMGIVRDGEGREMGIVTQEDIIRHYLGNVEL
jgi:CBS domain containing-hemolysin-like protein